MTEMAKRYSKVAETFTQRVEAVSPEGWDSDSPCEGWKARDIIDHLVSWMPGMLLARVGVELEGVPAVADDPAGAWRAVNQAIIDAVSDPEVVAKNVGDEGTFADAVEMYAIGDVLVHTWDLARATGQDDTIDADEAQRMYDRLLPNDELIRGEFFSAKVDVPDDADIQTRLIAFTGRTP